MNYRRMNFKALVIVAGLACLMTATPSFAGDSLFTAAASSEAQKVAPRSLRQRVVSIDTGYLTSHFAPVGKDKAKGRAKAANALPAKASIEVFPGETINLVRDNVDEAFGSGYVWTGTPVGDDTGSADLVIDDGSISGLIASKNHTYRIEGIKGAKGLHLITEVDPGAAPEGNDIRIPPKSTAPDPAPTPTESAAEATTKTRIDILLVYTTAAKAASANITSDLNLAISLANTGFTHSKVPITYKLVGVRELKGINDAATTFDKMLDDVTSSPVTKFKVIRTTRNTAKADLVSVIYKNDQYCGLGWLGVPKPQAAYGFSVVSISCISYYSFAHETGHNIGLNHDRYVVDGDTQAEFNFGYVNVGAGIRDIMSYNNKCADNLTDCTRVNYFSTPKVKVDGATIGIARGQTDPADTAQTLTKNRTIVAKFR